MIDDLEPLMTIDDVATYLNVTPRTVRRLRQEQRLPSITIGGSVRFKKASVIAWVEAREKTRAVKAKPGRPKKKPQGQLRLVNGKATYV